MGKKGTEREREKSRFSIGGTIIIVLLSRVNQKFRGRLVE
jgi:hypothetical protein